MNMPVILKTMLWNTPLHELYYKSDFINKIRSKKLAKTSRRLDMCAKDLAFILNLSQTNIEGKVCLEVGSGWVLSHALICYLLGAKKIIATDIEHISKPQYSRDAALASVQSEIYDILSPFSLDGELQNRLDTLMSLKKIDFEELKKINIDYVAPIDFAKEKLQEKVDFIYSFVALEHVPVNSMSGLLNNLSAMLNPNGIMIHIIHLEDHKNLNAPFDFFAETNYPDSLQSLRGNRIRPSQYKSMLDIIDGIEHRVVFQEFRKDKPLPEKINIPYQDENDLRTCNLGLYIKKK